MRNIQRYGHVHFVVGAHILKQDAPWYVLHILPPATDHLQRKTKRKRERKRERKRRRKKMEGDPRRRNNNYVKSNANIKNTRTTTTCALLPTSGSLRRHANINNANKHNAPQQDAKGRVALFIFTSRQMNNKQIKQMVDLNACRLNAGITQDTQA